MQASKRETMTPEKLHKSNLVFNEFADYCEGELYDVGRWTLKRECRFRNKSTDDRRYAISGLGKIKYVSAVKTLEKILLDGTEPEYIRADALMSLKSIGTKEAI